MLVDMKFLTRKNVLPQTDLLEKTAVKKATIKRFVYSSLSKELKTQTGIDCKKTKYQGFDKIYEFDKKQ